MGKKGRRFRVREPNLLIEAKQKMTREELLVWAWCLVNSRFWITDGDGRELTLEELEEIKKKQEVFYAVSSVDLEELRRKFPEHFSPRKVKYWRSVLKGLEKKIGFEVNYELYKQTLEELGFAYILEKFKQNKADKYFGIATIMAVGLSSDHKLTITYTPLVAPLLVLLKKWFTIYNFEEVLNLDLKASIVLYRLFKEKLGLRKNEFEGSKEDLIELLDLKKIEGRDLWRKYIEPAVKEINEKTSLKVKVEQIRRGRGRGGKIVGFRFKVEEEPRPEAATTKDFVENFELLKKWLRKTIEQLSKELGKDQEMGPIDLVNTLLNLQRVSPAVAIWFLLHFPSSEGKLYALEQVKWADTNLKLGLPEKFLQHGIQVPKKELQFLWDERVKQAISTLLLALKEEMEKELPSEEKEQLQKAEQEVIDLTSPKYWLSKFLDEDPDTWLKRFADDDDNFFDL